MITQILVMMILTVVLLLAAMTLLENFDMVLWLGFYILGVCIVAWSTREITQTQSPDDQNQLTTLDQARLDSVLSAPDLPASKGGPSPRRFAKTYPEMVPAP